MEYAVIFLPLLSSVVTYFGKGLGNLEACWPEYLYKNPEIIALRRVIKHHQKLLELNPISCKDISFKILGFSLATINTIFSIILSVIFIRLFFNYEKN